MKKALKISGITVSVLLVILVFLFFTPFLFREKFSGIVKATINKQLKSALNYSSLDLSFFHHFPTLTVTLSDFSLISSPPFKNDTLVRAKDIAFGIDLWSLFSGPVKVSSVYISKGRVWLKYDMQGKSNFDVFKSGSDTATSKEAPSGESARIRIERIIFSKTDFIYSDPSVPMEIAAHGINYRGSSNIEKDILHLDSRMQIDSLDFLYNNVPYLKSKPVKANLTTSIEMNTLTMKFEKNNLRIKDIPFEFRGEFHFRKDGYTFFLSLFSMFGDEYASGSLWLVSSEHLFVALKADVNMTLQNWVKGFGTKDMDLRGLFSMKINAQGEYFSGPDPASQTQDTVLLSIPDFTINAKLKNGFFRYTSLPSPVSAISFDLLASAKNHDYRTISVKADNFSAEFLKNKIEGFFHLDGLNDLPVEAHLSTKINLAEIRQVVPLDNFDLKGMLDLTLDVKGKYAPEKKLFPLSTVNFSLKDGSVKTSYYPRPIEKINVSAIVTNGTGKLDDTKIRLTPLSFLFEGNPFEVRADLMNPGNLSYAITAKGSVDLAKIYRVFSQKGMDLDGFIKADLDLRGKQSDALAGRIEKLRNSGRLDLRNIAFRSEFLPSPVILRSGVFRFENDKIWFEKFESNIGTSDITMDGHVSNVVNFVLAKNQKLKGSFTFLSGRINVDDFMAPESTTEKAKERATNPSATTREGVVVIPENFDIGLKADIKKITFGKLELADFNSEVEVNKGILYLKSMNFGLVGCTVSMDATYGSINPNKAFFDFHIKATEFDVKRAYNEVEMFRALASSAGKCEGIISLDYSLKGSLGDDMKPLYPSLEGSGVVTLKKVKVMGLKLFTEMSKNLGKEKIAQPDLTKVEIKSSIKNNVITVEKTKMKISGFRFRFEGQTNFNGGLNLKTRLGLPPLGIIGIPIRVLGTQDNPKFKYGRGVNDKDVDETEYSDEIPKELLDKIKSVKEEDQKDDSDDK
jgi:AsmA protein